MAKREMSSTLKSLKFMQRAVAQKEGTTKKEEEVKPDGNFFSASTVRKCVVIVEGDPHPGATRGRMSFLSFNPSIDKLNEKAAEHHHSDASDTGSGNQSKRSSLRENVSSVDGSGPSSDDISNGSVGNGNLKRKQSESVSGIKHPNKSPKFSQDDRQSSHQSSKGSHRQSKRESVDWNVLRQSKSKNRRG